ncbi:hypothetical protein TgHK011_006898 [Trichoderma gracile]|nr:hypothetical protein TgHK011_006898 [Trichoderma gracile]
MMRIISIITTIIITIDTITTAIIASTAPTALTSSSSLQVPLVRLRDSSGLRLPGSPTSLRQTWRPFSTVLTFRYQMMPRRGMQMLRNRGPRVVVMSRGRDIRRGIIIIIIATIIVTVVRGGWSSIKGVNTIKYTPCQGTLGRTGSLFQYNLHLHGQSLSSANSASSFLDILAQL